MTLYNVRVRDPRIRSWYNNSQLSHVSWGSIGEKGNITDSNSHEVENGTATTAAAAAAAATANYNEQASAKKWAQLRRDSAQLRRDSRTQPWHNSSQLSHVSWGNLADLRNSLKLSGEAKGKAESAWPRLLPQ